MKVLGIYSHPGEGITHFCDKTGLKEQEVIFPTQNIYVQYFTNIYDGFEVFFMLPFIHIQIIDKQAKKDLEKGYI